VEPAAAGVCGCGGDGGRGRVRSTAPEVHDRAPVLAGRQPPPHLLPLAPRPRWATVLVFNLFCLPTRHSYGNELSHLHSHVTCSSLSLVCLAASGNPRVPPEALATAFLAAWAFVATRAPNMRATPPLWAVAWLVGCGLALLPAPLLEPRYFTPPVALLLAHCDPLAPPITPSSALTTAAPAAVERRRGLGAAVCLAAAYALGTGLLAAAFLRPFAWPDGSTARFML